MGANEDAAKSGDRRRALEELRNTLAVQLDTTDSGVHAQIAGQYRATLTELAELDDGEGESDADAAAKRARLRLVGADAAEDSAG